MPGCRQKERSCCCKGDSQQEVRSCCKGDSQHEERSCCKGDSQQKARSCCKGDTSKCGNLLKKIYEVAQQEYLNFERPVTGRVINFFQPEELKKVLDLEYNECGISNEEEINKVVDQIVKYSVNTQNKHFYNQLYGSVDEVGLSSAWLMETLNTNVHTYEVAPVFVVIEQFMIKKLITIFGWEGGDGVFAPGGCIGNMYGILAARQKKYPNLKKTGNYGQKPMALMTSDMSHYSFEKGALFMGLGSDNVYNVKSNSNGQMTVEALRATIKKIRDDGKDPIFLNATAGTTVFGAYDPIEELADVCKEEQIWLHVDGCWGGSPILSKKHKSLLKGIEKADSLAWDSHKILCVPLQCSVFLIHHEGLLNEANSCGATYLFQPDKFYDISYDTGDKSIQCGRKGDSFKLWMMFKLTGLNEVESRIDNAFDMARYLEREIEKRENFELVVGSHQYTNVCFWYIPPSMTDQKRDSVWWERLHKVAPTIKGRMLSRGNVQVGYQPMESKNLVNFFRMIVTTWPRNTEEDMDFVLDEIDRCGREIQ